MYPEKKPELYGGDAFLLGKSPGEEQFKQAMGTLAPPQLQPGIKSQDGAEGQLWQGIQQQQQLGQSMASRRGYNPLAARAATAVGAEMESQGYGAAQGIRAGEEAQRRAQQLQAYQARSAYDQAMAQLGQQQFKGSLERQLYEDAMQRGLYETQRAKEKAEQEGWMNALSGGVQLAGDIINASTGGGAIGSDPSMKQNVGYGGSDVDRAMALFNPTGAKPDGGMGAKLGGLLKGASGILKGGMGGAAQIPGVGGVPIKDAELFNWSAQQSGQTVDPNMLKAAMASGGTLQGAPAAAGAGFNLGSIGGLLGGILSDPSMKQNIADGSEAVDNALYTREPFEGDAVARIRSLYGERGEQPVGNAILEETGDYGSATNPRTATMYLGDLPTGARIVQAPGVQNEIAAISKQLDEMTPFEQMIALNRGKAVPASERLASAGEAIGAASVAADPRFQQLREPLGSLKGMGVEMQDIGKGGPANTITRVEADPRSVRRSRGEIMLPEVTLRDTPYTMAERSAPQIAAALQQLDVPVQRGLATGRVEAPTSFAAELLDYQKKKQQNALAAQLAQKAEADREAAIAEPSADDIIKAYGDELLNTAEQSIMQTGGVDVQGVLGVPLPKDVGKKVDDTMDNVTPKRFEYKEGAKQDAAKRGISTPEGTNIGVMTSDLRKSQLGRSIVNPTDIGDTIDPSKALSLSLAAAARNNQKLRETEQTIRELKAKMNKRNA